MVLLLHICHCICSCLKKLIREIHFSRFLKLHSLSFFVLVGVPERAGTAAPTGSASPRGAPQNRAAAAMVSEPAMQAAFPPPETGVRYYPGGEQGMPCMRLASLFDLCFSNQNYFVVKQIKYKSYSEMRMCPTHF